MSRKQIIFIIIFLVIMIVGWSVYLLIPKSYVLFQTAPEVVYIKINNREEKAINNGDKLFLKPDKYKIIIYRDEFNPQLEEFTIKNGETKEIVAALRPLTEEAEKLLQNEQSSRVIERATAIEMDKNTDILRQKYPILKDLPLSNKYYRVTSCKSFKYPDDRLAIALCIEVADGFKSIVYEDFKLLEYNLDDYEIIWKSLN
ncbi:MAG: hypothetical protein WBI29_01690 [Candidatus Saccharimonadales bacterium]